MQVFYYKFKNTNYKLLCNNILKPGNTKESMFGSNSIKITLQLWYRIWDVCYSLVHRQCFRKAGSTKRANAPTKLPFQI